MGEKEREKKIERKGKQNWNGREMKLKGKYEINVKFFSTLPFHQAFFAFLPKDLL